MSRKTGRAIVASCALGAVAGAGILIYTIVAGGGGAAAQALPDAGKFRVGSQLGEERAGFSGRPMVMVFTSAIDSAAISACLLSPDVEALMGDFTGVLVEEAAEPDVESVLRARDDFQVVVRALNGSLLGGLRRGFTCADLAALLENVRKGITFIEKSPIYARLLESTEPIDVLKTEGKVAEAARYVELLKEFEGEGSAVAQAAEGALGK